MLAEAAMKKIRVFISYSSRDRGAAETIHGRLAAAGLDVWRDQTRLETDWSEEGSRQLIARVDSSQSRVHGYPRDISESQR